MSGNENDRPSSLEAQAPDSASDRRESPRVPLKLFVREADAGNSFMEKNGDIGVGGVYFEDPAPPVGAAVELRFTLPGRDVKVEIQCRGEIVRVCDCHGKFGAHVRFLEMSTEDELAIAKFLDDHELDRAG